MAPAMPALSPTESPEELVVSLLEGGLLSWLPVGWVSDVGVAVTVVGVVAEGGDGFAVVAVGVGAGATVVVRPGVATRQCQLKSQCILAVFGSDVIPSWVGLKYICMGVE